MNLPIRAAHAREAWLAIYLKAMECEIDDDDTGEQLSIEEVSDRGLREYVARFGDADLQEDLENCTAIKDARP